MQIAMFINLQFSIDHNQVEAMSRYLLIFLVDVVAYLFVDWFMVSHDYNIVWGV